MLRNDINGIVEGQATVDLINKTITEYESQMANNASSSKQKDSNPFQFIDDSIPAPHLSRAEQIAKLMKEAEKAILDKLGPDTDLSNSSDNSSVQDSQRTDSILSDKEMAEFYTRMCSRSIGHNTASGSNSATDMETSNDIIDKLDIPFFEGSKGSKKKKKNKGKK